MSTLLETRIRRNSPDFEQNTRRMVDLLTEIKNEEARLQEGGGAKAADAQHKKGRLTARERIARQEKCTSSANVRAASERLVSGRRACG